MRLSLLCLGCLIVVVGITTAVGYGPTEARWGVEGLRSMKAIATICLIAAAVGFIPMAVAAIWKPDFVGQAALAGTAIRLLVTLGLAGAYETLASPHLASFLFWAVLYYCMFLAVETVFGVLLVRRHYPGGQGMKGAST